MHTSQKPRVAKWTTCVLLGIVSVFVLTGCGGKQEKPKDPNYYDGPQKKLGDSQKDKGGGKDVQ